MSDKREPGTFIESDARVWIDRVQRGMEGPVQGQGVTRATLPLCVPVEEPDVAIEPAPAVPWHTGVIRCPWEKRAMLAQLDPSFVRVIAARPVWGWGWGAHAQDEFYTAPGEQGGPFRGFDLRIESPHAPCVSPYSTLIVEDIEDFLTRATAGADTDVLVHT